MRKSLRICGTLLSLAGLLACSSDSSNPVLTPKLKVEKARSWGRDYTRAKAQALTQPSAACGIFQRLAADRLTPAAPLAHARELEYCHQSDYAGAIRELDAMFDTASLSWLRPLLLEIMVELALKSSNNSALVKHSFARVQQLGSQHEKEDLLRHAIAAANTLGLSAKVAEFEAELYRISPRLKPNPDESQWLKAADDHRTNENWTEALAIYQNLIASANTSPMDHYKALNGIREVHKAKFRFYEGPVEPFFAASLRVAQYAEEKFRRPGNLTFDDLIKLFEAWIQYPRDVWSYGDVEIAKREINRVLGLSYVRQIFKAYAWWTLARIYANNADWKTAATSGRAGINILRNDLANESRWTKWHWTLFDEALWMTALSYRKDGNWVEASELLDLGLQHSPNSGPQLRFTFWLAQSLVDQGLTTVAQTYYEKLADADPFGYYGFLAHRELGRPLSPLPDLDLENPTRPDDMNVIDYDLLVALRFADEGPMAQRHSRAIMDPASVATDHLILRAFVHDYATIQALFFSRIPMAERNSFTAKYGRLFYPKPWEALVESAVQRNPRIEKEYVYSIMRQESAFNPLSHSWANAYGLLQLLPRVARETQAKAGVTFQEDYELYMPEVNIPIGVAHMDDLIDRAGAPFILRTSSYNATVEKTLEWRERLFQGDVYEFLEEIPYDETRSYIRLVMRNYIMNLRLNSAQPFPFPEHLLEL